MRFLSRVVWSEGMYLSPHHFQAQSRYFEDSIDFAVSTLWYQPYGLLGYALDDEALRNGTLALVHARGIFSDGMPFLMPESDELPEARPIAELFPPTRDRLTVLLGIPQHRTNGVNFALSDNARQVRYLAGTRAFCDETTGGDERPVQLGRKNIRFLLDTEPAEDLVTLPIARVMRDGAGHLMFDPEFIPPSLQISASERLMLLLRRLIEILEEKSATLSRSPGDARPLGDFSPRDIANFWLLHAVNSALAPLRHLWISKRSHPEELFVELSRLGGALCTFALDSHPRTLPLYDHERLSECFDALDRHIRAHLETIVPTNCVTIPLEKVSNYFYEGEITDTRCLGRARWVLGLHTSAGEADLITKAPQLVKICSAKFVGELVRRAIAGLTLTHLPVPPPAIPARLETQYFGITRSGPFWDHIVQTRRVGIYVPGELPDPEIELFVVLES
ncbi:MAG TPA: type VI secretion system baseplate subunit TssK [Bryobacteraceae bacterium]|nr:type VI secretion system baseplate subunit TssK [Bryobacteraceae bacterium]